MNSVLNTDSYDRRRFEQLFDMSHKMQDIEKKGREQLPSFQPLMGDIWAGLYKMKPQLQEEVKPELKLNNQFMERIMKEEIYQNFREVSRLDDFTSAVGSMRYSETVMGWIEEQQENDQELKDALKSIMNTNENGVSLHQASEALAQALKQNGSSLSEALKKAGEEVTQSKEQVKSLLGGIQAGTGEGDLKKMPLRDQLALAEKIRSMPKFKNISEWAGRFKKIAQKKQRSKHKNKIVLSGVTIGNQVEKLLPMELVNYSYLPTRLDFLRRFAEGQTMMFDSKDKEQLGKGPIVLCLDQSGSMDKQDEISKGFTLALMSIAKKQKRDFALILFSNKAETPQIFKRGKINAGDMINLAEIFLGGGTDFTSPLLEASKVISGSSFKKADIIFVTDGEADVDDSFITEWNILKKEKDFRVLSLILGTESDYIVNRFSDCVVKASSFQDEAIHAAFEI